MTAGFKTEFEGSEAHVRGIYPDPQQIRNYIEAQGIELVPVGPGNPKGNGPNEGAFSQMKKAIGRIQVDMSSPKALAKSVLNALVSLYIHMRNRLCLHNSNVMPKEKRLYPIKMNLADEQSNIDLKISLY